MQPSACGVLPPVELRLALGHEGGAAFLEIFAVHAGRADIGDRLHVAFGWVLEDFCDADSGRRDRQRPRRAFRDPAVPRCYAIAMAEPSALRREFQPYAAIGTWPRRGERGQVHLRLSRRLARDAAVTLTIGGQRFVLATAEADAWARDRRMDAAIVAAMRSAPAMWVSARDATGRPFGNSYRLEGAATAMDAATVGCARLR